MAKQNKRYLAQLISAILATSMLSGCVIDDDDDETSEEASSEVAYTLQLLHVADMDGSNADALANAGNFASNVTALTALYPNNTLFLSSGDNYIPGSRYEAGADESMAQLQAIGVPGVGRADIAMLNAMGLQASAVGNHDLDGGTAEFASIVATEAASGDYSYDYPGTQFPYLSSNMIFSDDENTAPLVVDDGQLASDIPNSLTSTTIIEVNGEKIGIVGATTPTNEVITDTGDITVLPADDSTEELATLIQEKVDALTATGIDKVILLAHMQTISIEKQLATLLKDVDIIVAGGSNTLLADSTDRLWDGDSAADDYPLLFEGTDGASVAVVNVDGDYKYLGRLVVGFDEDGHLLTDTIDADESGTYISDDDMVTELGGSANQDVDAIVSAVNDIIISDESNIVGHTDVYLNGLKAQVRSEETNLGDLTADANLWYAKLENSDVQISLKNGGGIRASIGYAEYPAGSTSAEDLVYYPPAAYPAAGKEQGDISQYDLQTTLAFNNALGIISVSAAELKEILEHGVSEIDPDDESNYGGGRFPQLSGLTFTFDATKTAQDLSNSVAGERVTNVVVDTDGDGIYDDTVVSNGTIQGDSSRTFTMVTLSYLAEGGDDYPFDCDEDTNSDGETYCTNVTYLEDNMSADPGLADFASSGTEQDAFAEYLQNYYPDSDTPYTTTDTLTDSSASDERIIRAD
ncbi:2',3'-cyclic-nucleotide 2'-phosphodiesterase/5'-or 3'-nucleotidase, 5'-nucleotidase family [Vibrio xiamenensis]|uniref:2',3'-cyclic-nucleotide 2'-phosphodiesterase/5'-or 3'-nucleotidase, 5'-nucleotidase family n=1 Tax=Vibrio xiamenensis TaxID=861298 RepID=A0A1G7ZEQ6_9VIBR|nr:bifunctional metallophosphatase/5'-nucleotidase [Vibrio xiamenensis]SDH06590.1 2',3'-cyclic-nucleotide 2'-phosphodiesterase/5'-or 3'-nucleotidase, 5'-nucleotidase family [Vibrio xiamenensis]